MAIPKIYLIFAPTLRLPTCGRRAALVKIMTMEEKRYPVIEDVDDGSCIAAEPAVAYTESPRVTYLNQEKPFDYPQDYDPGFGPYSVEEMNARIDKVELDRSNPERWIRVDDFWEAMQKEHLWLK